MSRRVSARNTPKPSEVSAPPVPVRVSRWWIWGILAVVVALTIFVRLRLAPIPLERDEGEYAYAGQLLLEGVPPYQAAYNMKLPGTYLAYAGILSVFGQTAAGVHHGLLVVNLCTIGLLFLLGRRLVDDVAGVVAAAVFATLSVSPVIYGQAAHATHFAALFATAGALALAYDSGLSGIWRAGLGGLLLGVAVLMKQPAALFVVFGAGVVFWQGYSAKPRDMRQGFLRMSGFCAGAVVPYLITCFWLWRAGTFERFWFWTVSYARQYGTILTVGDGWLNFKAMAGGIVRDAPGIWLLVALGVTALLWCRKVRGRAFFVLIFAVCAALAVCPGFYFRSHYFIVFLPAAAILAAVGVAGVQQLLADVGFVRYGLILPLVALGCIVGYQLAVSRAYLFQLPPAVLCRALYGGNPFVESPEVARYVAEHAAPEATIAVLGSEPQLYFYAHRRSATGYIYTYALMEPQPYATTMQKEMMREIQDKRPQYIVLANMHFSWLMRPESDPALWQWIPRYLGSFYVLDGVAISDGGATTYQWGPGIKALPQTESLTVWKRIPGK